MNLLLQSIAKFLLGVIILGLLIFLPAGSLLYWQGWLLMGILFVPMFVAGFVMMAKNPELLRKRLNAKEVADRYEAVCQENTLQGYYDYLKTRPNSVLADSVEKRMSLLAQDYFSTLRTEREVDSVAALFAQSPAVQNAAMKHKSRLAYRAASKTNTVEAFSLYLERYPRGDEYVAALNHLNTLRSNQYGLLSTPEQLATFAQTYSDSPLADSALAKLRKMVKEERDWSLIYRDSLSMTDRAFAPSSS